MNLLLRPSRCFSLIELLVFLAMGFCADAQAGSADKTGVFKRINILPFTVGGIEIGRSEITFVVPDGSGKIVKYVLLEQSPLMTNSTKEEKKTAEAMVKSMLRLDSDPGRTGLDLTKDPFPGVTFEKNQSPKTTEINCFGYAVMSSLGKGNAGFGNHSYWLENGKSEMTRGIDSYGEVLSNFFELKKTISIDKFQDLATDQSVLPGDIVNLVTAERRNLHAGVVVAHGRELWVRSKLGETAAVIEVPLERLLVGYKLARSAEIYRPKSQFVKNPIVAPASDQIDRESNSWKTGVATDGTQ